MKIKLLVLLFLSLWATPMLKSQKIKKIRNKNISDFVVRWDPNDLRIPSKSFEIGFWVELDGETQAKTKGYLNGALKWSNFKVKIDEGRFFNGKVTLKSDDSFKKGEYITVKIYKRRGKELIKEQKIPYNYEASVLPLLDKNITKAPGSKIKFGLRTLYNNDSFKDDWSSANLSNDFDFQASGGYIKKGKLFINSDPFSIKNHTVRVNAYLKKSPSINCDFSILLDYKKHYTYTNYGKDGNNGRHGENGPNGSRGENGGHGEHGWHGGDGYRSEDLEVFVDAYFDTILQTDLIYAEVTNLNSMSSKKYLINPIGGSLRIQNIGGEGGNGGDGGDGGDGRKGKDGAVHEETIQVNDSTTKTTTWQEKGHNGGNGGDGGNGGNGGYGGDGGDIFVVYTPVAKQYLNLIDPQSMGGSGGHSGFGGSSGNGGAGGKGDPNGNTGNSGRSGHSGAIGRSGHSGRVEWREVIENQ